jgi:hypothetical protein
MPDQIDNDGELTTRATEEVRAEPAEVEVVRPAAPPTVVVPQTPSPYRPDQAQQPGNQDQQAGYQGQQPGYQGQYAQPVQPYPYAAPGAPVSNGLATTGGILGIVGFVAGWIPLFGILFGIVLGILAIVFGSIGLSRSGKLPGAMGRGMAITGLVLGILIVILKLIPGVNVL